MRRKFVFLIIVGVLGIALVIVIARRWSLDGGQANFTDITEQSLTNAHTLSTPSGLYEEVAWLEENQLVFLYTSQPPELGFRWDYQIVLYNLGTAEWQVLTTPRPDQWSTLTRLEPNECTSGFILGLTQLPNGMLGFIYDCNVYHDNVTRRFYTLYAWDQQTGMLQSLQRYPENFSASRYAFAPDMSELIQASPVGAGLNDELYRVSEDGQRAQLFPGFQRVRSPAWSPDGHTIAFMGTETYLEEKSEDFFTWRQIEDLFYYPWDLYLMDANDKNVRIILPDIGAGGNVKWSPQGKFLSFGGQYNGLEGLWVLDTDTLKLTRIWPQGVAYEWSPDGRQIVVIEREEKEGVEYSDQLTYPVILDVPIGQ